MEQMDNTIKSINVEEILAEIRREIKEKGYKNEDISFSYVPVRVTDEGITCTEIFRRNLQDLGNKSKVVVNRPLKSNRSYGFLLIFFRKIVRKLLKFYIEPIIDDQNEINRLSTTCINNLYLDIDLLSIKVKALEYEISKLKEQLNSQ